MKNTTLENIGKDTFLFVLTIGIIATLHYVYTMLVRLFDCNPASEMVLIVCGAFIALVLYRAYEIRITGILNKTIFRARHLRRIELAHLHEQIIGELDLRALSSLMVERVSAIFDILPVALFVREEEGKHYRMIQSEGIDAPLECQVLDHDAGILHSLQRKRRHIFYKKSYHFLSWHEAVSVDNFFEQYRAKVIIPFFYDDELLAFLTLGDYTHIGRSSNDIQNFYYALSKYAGHAFKNAFMYAKCTKEAVLSYDGQGDLLQKLKSQAINSLATGIAHEIRNPLTIISLKAQTVLRKNRDGLTPDELADTMNVITTQIARATAITRRLINFANAGDESSPINFGALLEDMVEIISYQVSLDRIKVLKFIAHDMPLFHGIASEIREMMMNVVMNAVESVKDGGTICLHLEYQRDPGHIVFHVVDSGTPSFDVGATSRVFDPFYTSKNGSNQGLGLYGAQKIIHKYNGSIHLKPMEPRGIDVCILLPLPETDALQTMIHANDEYAFTEESTGNILPFDLVRDVVFNQQEVVNGKNVDSR